MTGTRSTNHIRALRESQGWTQAQLAEAADVSRPAISAMEQGRITPSVDAAMRIARAFGCHVEEVFSPRAAGDRADGLWAWPAASTPVRYWQARVNDRLIRIPVETTAQGLLAHDGVCSSTSQPPETRDTLHQLADHTLIIASCDPAVSLLLSAYAQRSGYRPICLHRTSREALELLRNGMIHVAGVHLARADTPGGSVAAVGQLLGAGHAVIHVACWESGVAVARSGRWTRQSLRRSNLRWIGRPVGSGARGCQDEILGDRPYPRRTVGSHRGVLEALRGGWADAGVCLRLVCEEAGMTFVPVRRECYDLCLRQSDAADPRVTALIDTIRSHEYRQMIKPLPGYHVSTAMGELEPIPLLAEGTRS